MRSSSYGFLALVLAVAGLAGCGGSSSGGTTGGDGGNPTAVTFTIKGPMPLAVAAQIGSGKFNTVTLSSGIVTLLIPEGTTTFALALNCAPQAQAVGSQTVTSNNQIVVEGSTADGTSFRGSCAQQAPTADMGTLTGSVDASAITGVNYTGVTGGNGSSSLGYFQTGATSNFSVAVPRGTDRVAVEGYVYSASNPFGANSVWTLAAVRNIDGVTVPGALNGGNPVMLGAADAVIMQPITYKNVPDGYQAPTTFAYFLWKDGAGGVWLSNGATTDYPAMPSAAAESGDYYSFSTTAYSQQMNGESVYVSTSSTTGGPQTITFPAAWKYAGPAAAALPTFDMSYSGFSGQTGVVDGASIGWQTGLGSGNPEQYSYQVLTSAKHQQGATTLAMPDLSAAPGFLTPPTSGTRAFWVTEIFQSANGFQQQATTSGTFQAVQNAGTYVVP